MGTEEEKKNTDVADLGRGRIGDTWLGIATYVNTEHICAKEMVFLPHQTCPEHRHPAVDGRPGGEETFPTQKSAQASRLSALRTTGLNQRA